MRRIPLVVALVLTTVITTPSASEPNEREGREAVLAKLDLQQKDMVAKADADGLAALSAPGLTINAPTGRVLTREQFLAMMRSGQIGAENFERTVESVTVSGNVGVVMGSEVLRLPRRANSDAPTAPFRSSAAIPTSMFARVARGGGSRGTRT